MRHKQVDQTEVSKKDCPEDIAKSVVGRLLEAKDIEGVMGSGCSFLQGRGFSNSVDEFCPPT